MLIIATAQLLPMGSCRDSRSKEKKTNFSTTGNHEDGSLLLLQYKSRAQFKMCVNVVNTTNCTTQKVNIRYTDYPLSSSASKFPLVMSVRYNNGRQIMVHKKEGSGIIGCGDINITLNITHLCVKFTSATEATDGKVVEVIKTCDDDVDQEKSWHIKFEKQYEECVQKGNKTSSTNSTLSPQQGNKTSSTNSTLSPQQGNKTSSTNSTLSPQQGESKTSLEPWKIALISCCIVSIAVALIGVYFWRWRITRNNNDDRANDNQNKEVQRVVYTSLSQNIQTV